MLYIAIMSSVRRPRRSGNRKYFIVDGPETWVHMVVYVLTRLCVGMWACGHGHVGVRACQYVDMAVVSLTG